MFNFVPRLVRDWVEVDRVHFDLAKIFIVTRADPAMLHWKRWQPLTHFFS